MRTYNTYRILGDENNSERVFPSSVSFAKELGITVGRLTKKLNGRMVLTRAEFEELERWLFEPIDYSNCGRNRKKGVKNR